MLGRFKDRFQLGSSGTKTHPPRWQDSLSWCPECGKQGKPDCLACRGELSPGPRASNIEFFKQRRDLADSELAELDGHIRYASPEVRLQVTATLRELLAEDFKTANRGKWNGNVALGAMAGHIILDGKGN